MRSKEKNMDLTSTENEAAKKVKKADKWADKPSMEVRDLHFSYGKNKVLKGVSLKIEEGKITTIMGANGCGKSTLGRLLVNLENPTEGEIFFHGISIQEILQKNEAEFRKTVQMVFQNPFDTFLQTETIEKIMLRPLVLYRKDMTDEEKKQRVTELLEEGGLSPAEDFLPRYPHELSGL